MILPMTKFFRRALRLTAVLVLLLGAMHSAQAQTTGTISGIVTDKDGALLPGVAVRVHATAGGEARAATTNKAGEYSFPALQPGDYAITFTATGFAVQTETATLNVTEHIAVNAMLHLATSASVEVTLQEPLLQTETVTLGDVISGQSVEQLPLATNNFTQLIALSPGVLAPANDATGLGRGTQNFNVNGARTNSNSVYIDGVDAVNVHVNGLSANTFGSNGVVVPPIDDIQQMKIQTALFDATTGRSGGSNTFVITKSGANDWHGSAYEYFRDTIFNANNYFLNAAGQPRPDLNQSQFGGTVGGHILRDKAFFFFGYQGTRQKNGYQGKTSIAEAAIPMDRSAASLGAWASTLGATSHSGPAIAANGSNISPVALAFLNLKFANGQYVVPSPNATINGATFYAASSPSIFNENLYLGTVDGQLTGKDHVKFSTIIAQQPQYYATASSRNAQGFGVNQFFKSRLAEVEESHVFTNNLVNDFHFGVSRLLGQTGEQNQIPLSSIGMTRFNSADFPDIPLIEWSSSLEFGYSVNADQADAETTWQYFDNVSWLKGKHSLNFGFEMRRYQDNYYSNNRMRGSLDFISIQNFLLGESGASAASGGNGTGYSDIYSMSVASGVVERYDRIRDVAMFAGDSWKPVPRMTLIAGVRWEYLGLPVDIYGRNGAFDPRRYQPAPNGGVTSAGFVQEGNARNPIAGIAKVSNTLTDNVGKLNFAPRVGMSYQLNNQMVLRGGYGLFYDRLSNQLGLLESLSVPNYERADSTNTSKNSNFNLTSSLANPFPVLPQRSQFPVLPQIYSTSAANAPAPLSINDVDPQLTTPYYEQWGLQLQTALNPLTSLEIGYVGTQGHHLPVETEINQALIASAANPVNGVTTNNTGTNDTALVRAPYQGFSNTGLLFLQTNTSSNFNSLQATLLRRAKTAQFTFSYMWSKSMDTNSGSTDGSVFTNLSGDQTNAHQAYALSDFDRTNHFTGRITQPIPMPRWAWAHTAVGKRIFGGYEVAAIGAIQSGVPFTVTYAAGATYYGTDQSRASYSATAVPGAIEKSGRVEDRIGEYFDTTAYSTGNSTVFGNVPRNTLRGPISRNLDLSLTKFIDLRDSTRLELRVQSFNVTNTPNFGLPNSDVGNAAFGEIATQINNPRLLQFVAKIDF
jgi:hypothetical protein